MTDRNDIENEILEKELTAARVTMDTILESIERETFLVLPDTTATICILHLKNGFTVHGYSACVSADNFDEELGRKISKNNALDQCWPLFGFLLASLKSGVFFLPKLK